MKKPDNIHKYIKAVFVTMMAIGLGLSVYEGHWIETALIAMIMVVTLLPYLLGKQFAVYIPHEFEIVALIFIFASVILGEVGGYYHKYWWWDKVLHASAGLMLGVVGFLLVYVLNQQERVHLHMKPGFIALFSFSFAMCIGALWEIFEFTADSAFGMNMQKSGLVDTMWDLIIDACGAFIVSCAGYLHMRNGSKSYIERVIDRFVQGNPELFRERDQKKRL